ncbi:MAG TPA: lysophospholipid acyltransferase family protein [Caulobacterales bacterium]|nr:lysophospholipid acyltransferase family protein [Caulobacterales bacterium]
MLKQLLASPIVQLLIGRGIGLYMHLVALTTRWRKVNRASAERVWASREHAIVCIWHGRFLLVHKLWRFDAQTQKAWFLISQSREGGVVTHASRTVGADVVRGSAAKGTKRKGGFEALREILRILGHNEVVGMTPDGPRGPRMRASIGPLQVAKLSGAPILPVAWSTQWRIVVNSWDRFILPLPFGRGALIWGEPIRVAREAGAAEMEAARLALEDELNRISAEADRLAGALVIEPEPAPEPVREAPAPAVQTT